MSLSRGSRKSFSSPEVRMRGALLSAGSTRYLFADLCQEPDISSIAGAGGPPLTTEWTWSACPPTNWTDLVKRCEPAIHPPGSLSTCSWQRDVVQFYGARRGKARQSTRYRDTALAG